MTPKSVCVCGWGEGGRGSGGRVRGGDIYVFVEKNSSLLPFGMCSNVRIHISIFDLCKLHNTTAFSLSFSLSLSLSLSLSKCYLTDRLVSLTDAIRLIGENLL